MPARTHPTARTSLVRAAVPTLAVLALVAATAGVAMRTIATLEVPGHPELPLYGMQDFRDTLYYPVRTFLAGDNPYSPSAIRRHFAAGSVFPLYTPIALLVHLPFGFLSQRTGEAVHFLLNTLLTIGLAWTCLRLCDLPRTVTTVAGVATILILSRPGHVNLHWGECAAYLTIAAYFALRLGRTRPHVAAAWFALTCLKPTFGVPVGLLLLATGAVRACLLGGTLAFVVSAIVGTFVIRAAGGVSGFLASLRENAGWWSQLQEASGATGIHSIDAIAFFDRLRDLPPALEALLSITILAVGALAVARATCRSQPLLAEAVAALVVLTFSHHQIYDGLLLALPAVAVATGRLPLPATPSGQALRVGLLISIALASFNYLATYQALDAFGLSGPLRLVVVSAPGGALVLVLAALVGLALGNGLGNTPVAVATATRSS